MPTVLLQRYNTSNSIVCLEKKLIIVILMYPVLSITHMLKILDKFSMGVTKKNCHICGKWIQNSYNLEEHSSTFDIYNNNLFKYISFVDKQLIQTILDNLFSFFFSFSFSSPFFYCCCCCQDSYF